MFEKSRLGVYRPGKHKTGRLIEKMGEGNSLLSNTEKFKFISTDFPYARNCVLLSKTTFYCLFLNFGVEKKDGMSWKEIMFSLRTLV